MKAKLLLLFAAAGLLAVTPATAATWTYASSSFFSRSGTLTHCSDTAWVLDVTRNGKRLTVTGVNAAPPTLSPLFITH